MSLLSNPSLIESLNEQLSSEIVPNPENSDSIAFLNNLIFKKHEQTGNQLRKQVVLNNTYSDKLSVYENRIVNGLFQTNDVMENELKKLKESKRRRLSVDFRAIEPITTTSTSTTKEDDDNLTQLRSRLLSGSKPAVEKSLDDQLQLEESQQEVHLENMLSLLGSLREGAFAFNEKLQEDGNILKAAEAGLDSTKNKLQQSGEVLKKINVENVSLFQALKFGGVCILLFLLALIVIKLFPKW